MRLTGFMERKFPVTYLGVLLVSGRLTSQDLEPLITKIRNKVANWKLRLVSQSAQLVLLKHILSSMATYLLAILHVPMVVFKKINVVLSTFL